jgi:hypothetical protein
MNRSAIIFIGVVVALLIAVFMNDRAGKEALNETLQKNRDALFLMEQNEEKKKKGIPYLEKCRVCSGDVSSAAAKCPHCGDDR